MPQDSAKLLTIILTLKDRASFTYRWMKWMNEVGCPYLILIADGGLDKEIEQHLERYENYPSLNYRYIKYPYDNSYNDYYEKISSVINMVETPYLILADNDDFLFPDKFSAHLNFMENNKDYSVCVPRVLRFKIFQSNNLSQIYGDKCEFRTSYFASNNETELAIDRFKHAFYDYSSNIWYGILKADTAKTIFSDAKKIAFKDLVLMEYFVIASLAIRGKIKFYDEVYLVRQDDTPSQATDHAKSALGGKYDFFISCMSNHDDVEKLKCAFLKMLFDGKDNLEANNDLLVYDALKLMLSYHEKTNLFNKAVSPLYAKIKKFAFLPFFKKIILFYINSILATKYKNPLFFRSNVFAAGVISKKYSFLRRLEIFLARGIKNV